MSAPRSVHQVAQRRAQLIIEREYRPDPARCIAAIVRLLTYRAPADTPSADDACRPLGAGDRPTMHDGRASRPRDCAATEEDEHRESLTTPDA